MNKLQIKLKKSPNGAISRHKKTLKSLGLTKINQMIVVDRLDSVLGKVRQIGYLLEVREV